MSQYNLADPRDAYGCKNLPMMLFRRARMEGFLASAGGREAEFEALLHRLYAEGKLLKRSHVIEGLENARGRSDKCCATTYRHGGGQLPRTGLADRVSRLTAAISNLRSETDSSDSTPDPWRLPTPA